MRASQELLSRSSLEPLISLDLVSKKLYSFMARVHGYCCLYIILSANTVRRFEELRGALRKTRSFVIGQFRSKLITGFSL